MFTYVVVKCSVDRAEAIFLGHCDVDESCVQREVQQVTLASLEGCVHVELNCARDDRVNVVRRDLQLTSVGEPDNGLNGLPRRVTHGHTDWLILTDLGQSILVQQSTMHHKRHFMCPKFLSVQFDDQITELLILPHFV